MKARKIIFYFGFILQSFTIVKGHDTLKFNDLKDCTDYITANYRSKYTNVQFFKHTFITPIFNVYSMKKDSIYLAWEA